VPGPASQDLVIHGANSVMVAYMQALVEGLTVAELADTSARDEVKVMTARVKKLPKV